MPSAHAQNMRAVQRSWLGGKAGVARVQVVAHAAVVWCSTLANSARTWLGGRAELVHVQAAAGGQDDVIPAHAKVTIASTSKNNKYKSPYMLIIDCKNKQSINPFFNQEMRPMPWLASLERGDTGRSTPDKPAPP